METTSLFTTVLALAFVLGLIGLINVGLKRFGPEKIFYALQKKKGSVRRLSIEETLVIDARRRIVLVKCDKTEHLILLGATTEQVIAKSAATKKAHA
jgi:flagellar protein FliO/FliZ